MLELGAFEEVKNLVNQGISDDKQITKTLGFLEIREFLNERMSHQKMVEIATQKTRNYAKRQLTWFRHQLPQKHVFSDSAAALNFLKNEI
jgi:tRNA dimethylallyltransferase